MVATTAQAHIFCSQVAELIPKTLKRMAGDKILTRLSDRCNCHCHGLQPLKLAGLKTGLCVKKRHAAVPWTTLLSVIQELMDASDGRDVTCSELHSHTYKTTLSHQMNSSFSAVSSCWAPNLRILPNTRVCSRQVDVHQLHSCVCGRGEVLINDTPLSSHVWPTSSTQTAAAVFVEHTGSGLMGVVLDLHGSTHDFDVAIVTSFFHQFTRSLRRVADHPFWPSETPGPRSKWSPHCHVQTTNLDHSHVTHLPTLTTLAAPSCPCLLTTSL